eukprot:611203_1
MHELNQIFSEWKTDEFVYDVKEVEADLTRIAQTKNGFIEVLDVDSIMKCWILSNPYEIQLKRYRMNGANHARMKMYDLLLQYHQDLIAPHLLIPTHIVKNTNINLSDVSVLFEAPRWRVLSRPQFDLFAIRVCKWNGEEMRNPIYVEYEASKVGIFNTKIISTVQNSRDTQKNEVTMPTMKDTNHRSQQIVNVGA